jgi:hypothetical protein
MPHFAALRPAHAKSQSTPDELSYATLFFALMRRPAFGRFIQPDGSALNGSIPETVEYVTVDIVQAPTLYLTAQSEFRPMGL